MPLTMATPLVLTDPGFLLTADLASTVPSMAALASSNTAGSSYSAEAWAAAWKPVGATEDGSQFSYEMTVEPISVDELFNAVMYAPTGVDISISFAMVDFTLHNLARALNAPSTNVTTVSGSAGTLSSKFAPPTPTQIKRRMIGWESLDGSMRMVAYQCLSGGSIQASMQRAPAKAALATTWRVEQPAAGDAFNFWGAGTRLGTGA